MVSLWTRVPTWKQPGCDVLGERRGNIDEISQLGDAMLLIMASPVKCMCVHVVKGVIPLLLFLTHTHTCTHQPMTFADLLGP